MKKLITLIIMTLLVALLLATYSLNVNSSLAQGIVRLHVIANSDSDEDQILKLRIRDAILAQSSADFTTKAEVGEKLEQYKRIAENVIAENGYNYNVDVEYGNFPFPTKHYENISLPAGNYDAVRVTIGSGKGKNWWCVLFPPLCFVDGTTDSSKVATKMKSTLSKSNYDLITAKSKNGGVPVNIKFKIVEFYGKFSNKNKIYAKARKDKIYENESKKSS